MSGKDKKKYFTIFEPKLPHLRPLSLDYFLQREAIRKKPLSLRHFPKVALTPLPPSFLNILEVFFVSPHLDNCEVTFISAKDSNIYQIFRQKLPQNYWNMVKPTFPPCPKRGSKLGKTKQPPPPPLLWTMSKRKMLFLLCLP